MKLSDIVTESKDLSEAPNVLGAVGGAAKSVGKGAVNTLRSAGQSLANRAKTTGLKAASKISSTATGKLAVDKESKELIKDYNFYVGSSGGKPTADSLIKFLQQEKHPIASAQAAISKIPGINQNPQLPIPTGTVNQIMNTVAGELVSTGRVQSPSASTPQGKQTTSTAGSLLNVGQIKSAIAAFDTLGQQEIINHLKKIDTFKKLKF
jgi:hypothetical protein